jgi:hypothetical protein
VVHADQLLVALLWGRACLDLKEFLAIFFLKSILMEMRRRRYKNN